jgi:Alpha/beta hydrolase family
VTRASSVARRGVRLRYVALVLAALLGIAAIAVAWWLQPQPLLPEASASLASTAEVTFTEVDGRLEWRPAAGGYETGLVLYPGAKVPAPAYGPAAQAIAASGYLVVVVPMPLNLAVLDIDAADRVLAAHPEIGRWAIGGHSLGGAMASQYAGGHPERIDGLALWAAYPATDVSTAPIRAVTVYGSLDAGADRMSGPEARADLPGDATFVAIEGGNHEQMGWYTGQPNDPPATISREDQQRQLVDATLGMLASL